MSIPSETDRATARNAIIKIADALPGLMEYMDEFRAEASFGQETKGFTVESLQRLADGLREVQATVERLRDIASEGGAVR